MRLRISGNFLIHFLKLVVSYFLLFIYLSYLSRPLIVTFKVPLTKG